MPLPELVAAQRFTPVRFSEGYDMDEVDRFLARVEEVAGRADPAEIEALRGDIGTVRFVPVRFSEGYDMDEVDRFLDTVVLPGLEEIAGSGPVTCGYVATLLAGTSFPRARIGAVYAAPAIDRLIQEATAALQGLGDEEERRRRALALLESARPPVIGGLSAGYRRQDVDDRLRSIVNLLRRT